MPTVTAQGADMWVFFLAKHRCFQQFGPDLSSSWLFFCGKSMIVWPQIGRPNKNHIPHLQWSGVVRTKLEICQVLVWSDSNYQILSVFLAWMMMMMMLIHIHTHIHHIQPLHRHTHTHNAYTHTYIHTETQRHRPTDIHLGKFHHDLTATEPWKSWLVRGIIPIWS